MKTMHLGMMFGVGALVCSFVACSQAKTQCVVGHAGATAYIAKYYPKGTPPDACAQPGDFVGFETYHPAGGGDEGKQPDFSKPAVVAFQVDTMGAIQADKASKGSVDADATHKPYSIGNFATIEPGADGFCLVDAPKPAEQDFPKVDAVPGMGGGDPGSPEEPATTVKYEWSNVKLYVTASAQGTQFSGDLKFTQDTCTAEYSVAGVWPAIDCTEIGPDGKPTGKGADALCCPNADPNGGRITGSGINPDFPLKCDPVLFQCVLDIPDPSKLPAISVGWADKAAACKLTPAAGSTATGG